MNGVSHDFWLPEKTSVHALFNGEVIIATNDAGYKDYGGLIVLKHTFNDLKFYTLYGHLSVESIKKLKVGDTIKKGEEITPEKEAELFDNIKSRYDKQISPYYAAARIWTDGVIEPLDTRTWISMGIEAANHAPIEKPFNLGVLQV